jgi:hypothetical protein
MAKSGGGDPCRGPPPRAGELLHRLPEEERTEWRKLWEEAAGLLARAGAPAPTAPTASGGRTVNRAEPKQLAAVIADPDDDAVRLV